MVLIRELRRWTLLFVAVAWHGLTAHSAAGQTEPKPASMETVAPGLYPEHLYTGLRRPCMIRVVSPRSFGTVTLALMDHHGASMAAKVTVHPGRIDLNEVFQDGLLWHLDRAAYLQMLDGEQPVGSALVVQPLLARMVPVTETSHRANGVAFTKIIGWADENDLAATPPATKPAEQSNAGSDATSNAAATDQASRDTTEGDQSAPDDQTDDTPESIKPRLMSGVRMYVENDVILHTTKGDIRVAFRPDEAPNTVWNFLELCRGGLYRDVPFHRVVPFTATGQPFVIQAGDPSINDAGQATGDGGPGYWLPIEPSRLPHDFGVISMARNDDPDSNGSQFFFALSREGCARLDGQYCSFGYAVDGAETIKSIAQVELSNVAEGRPTHPPVMTAVELVAAPPRSPGEGRPDKRVTPDKPKPETTRPGRISR